MTKEESERISGLISQVIAQRAPTVEFSEVEAEEIRRAFSEEELDSLRERGWLGSDFALFLSVQWLVDGLKLTEVADERYVRALFQNARRFDVSWFCDNPYIKEVSVPKQRMGNYLLTCGSYDAGEFFQYDMPDLSGDLVVPRLGLFGERVEFPTIYEGRIPWMSVCPSEIFSMEGPIRQARGTVLVLGLGLGYYPFMISRKDTVEEIVISLFCRYLLPQFRRKEKIRVVHQDAFAYLESLRCDGGFAQDETGRHFDVCFADIWENQVDGARDYTRIREHEKRLPMTKFTYWIEDAIAWQLDCEEQDGSVTDLGR